MRDDEFEWDDAKAASNYRKHNVTFEQARTAFDDPDCVDRDDPDPDEQRIIRLCRLGQRILVIVWTQRGNRVRIISARPANANEQRAYFQQ